MALLTARPQAVGMVPQSVPIWRETLWPMEWLALRMSAVYHGDGVPEGDGGAVVVVPGFMCSDTVTAELRNWLRRIGYKPYMSGIGLNVDCPTATSKRLERTVERAYKDTGRPVRIVGHSLGGMIGRRVALERPDHVRQVV
jgi:triacylglycerol lipase